MMVVSGLWRYPVKSLVGAACETLQVNDWGPAGDRRWMLVDDSGRFLSQRQLPMMCRLQARETPSGIAIVDLDSAASIEVATPGSAAPARSVVVWGDDCRGLDAGDAVAQWLAARLGRVLRLCYMPDEEHRQVDLNYAQPGDRVSFADGFPFLLCHQRSVDWLSEKLGRTLEMSRFRPNLVVDGGEAFAERQWRRLAVGNIEFDVVKPCSRCVIPSIAPHSGERETEVFALLREHCSDGAEVVFGQNLIQRGTGSIALGDVVRPLA
ncbi:MOSC domain-containing protein [Spongiibacter sp.]|uniref:MOSC domain-containing protein n=1 Tax=Spongiibacter sp. TaxID=2024860 RepID=UPI00356A26F2